MNNHNKTLQVVYLSIVKWLNLLKCKIVLLIWQCMDIFKPGSIFVVCHIKHHNLLWIHELFKQNLFKIMFLHFCLLLFVTCFHENSHLISRIIYASVANMKNNWRLVCFCTSIYFLLKLTCLYDMPSYTLNYN